MQQFTQEVTLILNIPSAPVRFSNMHSTQYLIRTTFVNLVCTTQQMYLIRSSNKGICIKKPKRLLGLNTSFPISPIFLNTFLMLRNPSAVTNKSAIINTNNVEYLIVVVNNVVDKIKLSGKSAGAFYQNLTRMKIKFRHA